MLDAAQAPALLEFFGKGLDRLLCLVGHGSHPVGEFFLAKLDLLLLRDALEEEVVFQIHLSPLGSCSKDFVLPFFDLVFRHARAQTVFHHLVGLALGLRVEEFGGKIELYHGGQFVEKLADFEFLDLLIELVFEISPNGLGKPIDIGTGQDLGGQFIGQVGKGLFLDALQGDMKIEFKSAEFLDGKLLRDRTLEIALLVQCGTLQGLGEPGQDRVVLHLEPVVLPAAEIAH